MGWLCALGTCGAFWPYYCGRREAVAYGFPALCLVGWGLIFAGRIDAVSFNCSLSLLAILWIGLGSWLDEFGWYLEGNSYQGSRWLVAAVIGASLLGSLVQLVTQPIDPRFYVNRYAAAEEYRHVVQEVLRTKAPVLAQDIGPVLDAGLKPEVVNLRALSRLSQQGVADAAAGAGAVVERLNNGGYGLVVLVDSIDDAEETALSPAMKVALLANYRVWSRTGYSVLYRPIDELSP
jgi:hypothetical protein